jgi:hypothetical protein
VAGIARIVGEDLVAGWRAQAGGVHTAAESVLSGRGVR